MYNNNNNHVASLYISPSFTPFVFFSLVPLFIVISIRYVFGVNLLYGTC